jgi:hypothetical protein
LFRIHFKDYFNGLLDMIAFQPEGLKCDSPGQRPGYAITHIHSEPCKGEMNGRRTQTSHSRPPELLSPVGFSRLHNPGQTGEILDRRTGLETRLRFQQPVDRIMNRWTNLHQQVAARL